MLILAATLAHGQEIKLMDHLSYPRLDSSYWQIDFETLNADYPNIANRRETCVYEETDSTRGRFCFNTSLGHVQMEAGIQKLWPEKLVGTWEVIEYGKFEIIDSLVLDSAVYHRRSRMLSDQKGDLGDIVFTDTQFKFKLQNIKEFPNKKKHYSILNGKYLTTRNMGAYCGATGIGLTEDGYLLIDDHTFRTLATDGRSLVTTTSIRRFILRKRANP